MAMTVLQSQSVPIYLSTDGTTFESVVCKRGVTFNASTSITEEETDCGPAIGIGSVKWSFDIDAVVNITPSAGQCSYEKILGYVMNQTYLYIRFNYPDDAGTDFKKEGRCYLTNLRGQAQQGNAMNFTTTATGNGLLTIV